MNKTLEDNKSLVPSSLQQEDIFPFFKSGVSGGAVGSCLGLFSRKVPMRQTINIPIFLRSQSCQQGQVRYRGELLWCDPGTNRYITGSGRGHFSHIIVIECRGGWDGQPFMVDFVDSKNIFGVTNIRAYN